MSAYFGPWRLVCPQPVTPAIMALARKLVGGMLDVGGIPTRTWKLDDGTVITALIVNDLPKVTITLPRGQGVATTVPEGMWIPRGFVVYPAWHDAPFGVGVPIVRDDSVPPYDQRNLAPGLDRQRWTAGGIWGEVLVTPVAGAGYQAAMTVPTPVLYETGRGPQYTGQPGASATWTAYRLELAPFEALEPSDNAAVQATLFERLNSARAVAGVQPATLRLRGYAQPAALAASMMATYATDAASSTAYPRTYRTPADRLTKEGYPADWIGNAFASFGRGDTWSSFEFRGRGGADIATQWTAPGSAMLADFGRSALLDVGFRDGYAAAAIVDNDRWIHTGNMSWQSEDAALPPVSWHGFGSLNLAWETYPATWSGALTPLYAFTNADGDVWLNYPRATTPTSSDAEPAMGRHIYCRGRAIALAPGGALVWGACVIPSLQVRQNAPVVDRMVLLAHHPGDQPADYQNNGWTRYLRVWWVDIPPRALRLAPDQVICGTDAEDVLAWRGGTLVDVGAMPPPSTGGAVPIGTCSSLKYASQWRFSADGLRAVCLRDYGVYADYASLDTGGQSMPSGLEGRAVELRFTPDADSTAVQVIWHDYTGDVSKPQTTVGAVTKWRAVAQAVDFDAAGELVFAFVATTNETLGVINEWDTHYLGTGPAATQWYDDLALRVQYGAKAATPTQDFAPSDVLVADVRRGAFVVIGVQPEYKADGESNPGWTMCWPFTEAPMHGVRMYLDGAQQDERWFPAPDGTVVAPVYVCTIPQQGSVLYLTWLPPAASAMAQVYWSERDGEWVFCYQLSPVPQCCRVLDEPSPAPAPNDNCGCWVSSYDVLNRSHWMAASELNPRGGAALASVPLPDNDWLIFSKVA